MGTQYIELRAADFLSRLLPLRLSYWIGLRAADHLFRRDARGRRAVMENLRHILRFQGQDPSDVRLESLARCVFQHFGNADSPGWVQPVIVRRSGGSPGLKEKISRTSCMRPSAMQLSAYLIVRQTCSSKSLPEMDGPAICRMIPGTGALLIVAVHSPSVRIVICDPPRTMPRSANGLRLKKKRRMVSPSRR